AAQPYSDNYYQAPKPKRSNATLSSTRPSASTRHKGKEIAKPVVQQTGIQCFNCKGFGHYAKEYRKPKRVKDYSYHKEKMMMCKQAEHGVPLQPEQADWLADTDEEIDKQELEAHYKYADEGAAFANLIANLTLDTKENKTILKKANSSLTQELEECKTNLDETSRALGEATSCRDSCLIA
ncbi:hypothetical protein Tco_0197934, partial [Tanacetum coccineum]